MLKLNLDWAAEGVPAPEGVDPHDEQIRVELVSEVGPSGWPEIAVYAGCAPFEPAYMADMRLDGWLRAVYLVGLDEAEAEVQSEDLRGLAEEV